MSEQELFLVQLGKLFPEDKSLSPIEVSNLFDDFFAKRGLKIKVEYKMKYELTQELISRIRSSYNDFKNDIKRILRFQSERLVRNKYYEMVYAILEHHHYGIANKNKKLITISYCRFADIFEVNRKTTSGNQIITDFYSEKRQKQYEELKKIFYKIENVIINK